MLRSLQIKNIAVIKSADIHMGNAFTVLTGETGAGKSIIIDSISLLMGSRAPRELIRSGESRANVSALFENVSCNTTALLDEYEVERELAAADVARFEKQLRDGVCASRKCLAPTPCKNLRVDHTEYMRLLEEIEALPRRGCGSRPCPRP